MKMKRAKLIIDKDKLELEMLKTGYTRKKLAEDMNMDYYYLCKMINEKGLLSSQINFIAFKLGCPVEDLVKQ